MPAGQLDLVQLLRRARWEIAGAIEALNAGDRSALDQALGAALADVDSAMTAAIDGLDVAGDRSAGDDGAGAGVEPG